MTFAFTVAMLSTTLPTPLYPIYQRQFGFSELMVTVIFAVYAVGVVSSLLLFGRLSDEIGRRGVLLPALGFAVLSAVTFLLAQGVAMLMLGRLLSGLSAGIFTGAATAALLDLAAPQGRARATLVATIANMGGLGLGALVAGLIAQWAASPLRVPFWINLALLIPAAIGVWLMPEAVSGAGRFGIRPQALRVPPAIRPTFVRAALAAFAGFSVLGLFTAVAPAFLASLGVSSHAIVGLVVFSVFFASTAGQVALEQVRGAVAMQYGCVALTAGMALLALGLALSSLALLIGGGLVAGFGQGLAFRAGLSRVNAESPASQRGEVASSFFVCAYVGIAIPVVGEGVLAQLTSLRTAGLVFAGLVAALSLTVLALLARPAAVVPSP